MRIRLMPRRILARILPKETKAGSIFLPENRVIGAGTQGGFEPVKVQVVDIGPEVHGIAVGDVLVLSNLELDKVDDEHVIVPFTLFGDHYHPRTLRRYKNKREIARAKDDEVMAGIILYVETPEME